MTATLERVRAAKGIRPECLEEIATRIGRIRAELAGLEARRGTLHAEATQLGQAVLFPQGSPGDTESPCKLPGCYSCNGGGS